MHADEDEVITWLEGEDPAMREAIERAHATLGEFRAELLLDDRRVVPAIEVAIIKAFFPHPDNPCRGEHLWVDQLVVESDHFAGNISGRPVYVPGLFEGQAVRIPPELVSDWILVVQGKGHGGFTLPVVRGRLSAQEAAQLMTQPPFSWFP